MCNCASKTPPVHKNVAQATPPESFVKPSRRMATVEFEYTGQTAMTVRGPFSGLRYRFHQPGARVQVDERDANSLAAIPGLQTRPAG
jgi:hypothetical protein